MAKCEKLKKNAKGALETIAGISSEAYRVAEEKARTLARKAKLNMEITYEQAFIRRQKMHIGHKYYEMYKDIPEEAFKGNCENITDSIDRIHNKRKELAELKKSSSTRTRSAISRKSASKDDNNAQSDSAQNA